MSIAFFLGGFMEEKLKNNSILKTILIMGLPPIISMLIQSLYSIVDGILNIKKRIKQVLCRIIVPGADSRFPLEHFARSACVF